MLWRQVAGVFIWLLFGIDISGNALWLLPILSLLCVLLKDGFMIRWGHMEAVTKNEETGELSGGRVVMDGDFITNTMYAVVCAVRCHGLWPSSMGVAYMPDDWWASARHGVAALCAVMVMVKSVLVAASNAKKEKKRQFEENKRAEMKKAFEKAKGGGKGKGEDDGGDTEPAAPARRKDR